MPITVYFHPQSMTTQQYGQIMDKLMSGGHLPAKGGLSHTCLGEEGHLMVFDVWETREDWENFARTLLPIIESVGITDGKPHISPVVSHMATEYSTEAEPAGV